MVTNTSHSETLIYRGYYIVTQSDGDGGTDYHVYSEKDPESFIQTCDSELTAQTFIDHRRRERVQLGLNPIG